MILIDLSGIEIRLENEKWTCKDKDIEEIFSFYDYDFLEFYSPFKDLSLAELATKEMAGKIIKITNKPKFVKGRIY